MKITKQYENLLLRESNSEICDSQRDLAEYSSRLRCKILDALTCYRFEG